MSALVIDLFVVVLCDILGERVCVCVCFGKCWRTWANHTVCRSSRAAWPFGTPLTACQSGQHAKSTGLVYTLEHRPMASSTQTPGLLFDAVLLKQSQATLQVEKDQIGASSSLLLFWLSLWPHLTPRSPLTPMRRFDFTQTSGYIHIIAVLLQKQCFDFMWRQCQCWKS